MSGTHRRIDPFFFFSCDDVAEKLPWRGSFGTTILLTVFVICGLRVQFNYLLVKGANNK